ncbi:unnamed protein product [Sphagnum tenellum]
MLQLVSSHLSIPSQVEKLQMKLSNAMDVEESLLSKFDKLEEVIALKKEKCESWEINCKKLEEQIVLARSIMQEERDARMKLSEEIQ